MATDTFRILVVDDEPYMVSFLKQALERHNFEVEGFTNGQSALDYLGDHSAELMLADYKMPGMLGIELLEKVKATYPEIGVIIMTAYGTIENAVKALKLGGADFITKPFSVSDIYEIIDGFITSSERKETNISVRGEDRFGEMIGKSPQMKHIYKTISLVANSRASVFIYGPSGTGKELVARAIHYNSERSDMPFIRVNCAALPESLMESELFGHEKGAFTGAIRKNVGKFELADTGTLLLDEITEMDIGLQAKLLRAIQEKEFHRVGGDEQIEVDVRILSTSNRDLHTAIEEGKLREDLYYRLNTIPIELLPLSERREDIKLLVYHFMDKFRDETDSNVSELEDRALKRLLREDFPGNIRELENRILRAMILTQSNILTEDVLFIDDHNGESEPNSLLNMHTPVTIEEMERDLILQTLEYHDYSRTKSAESLGINVRTLRNKLNKYMEDGHISGSFFAD